MSLELRATLGQNGIVVIARIVLFLCAVLDAAPLFSQSPDMLSMQRCLELARRNYPSIRAKEADLRSQEMKLLSSKTEYLPALNAGGQINYATNNGVNGTAYPNDGMSVNVSGGIRPVNIYTPVFGSFATLEANWKVFNFGKVAANVDVARSAVRVSQADFDNEVFQHQIKVADAYLLSLVMMKISSAQSNNLERAEKVYSITKAAVNAGLKAGTDSSFAAAEVSKARLLFLDSRRNELTQLIRLAELMGETSSDISIDSSRFFNDPPKDFDADTSRLSSSPIAKLYHSRWEYRLSRSTAIKRSYAPSISLVGIGFARGSGISNQDNTFRRDFSSGVGFQAYNYLAAVSFKMNLLNFPRVHDDFRSEMYEAQRDQMLYQEAKLKTGKQLDVSNVQLTIARQQADEAPIQFAAARSAYQQASSRYNSGLSTLAELAQSFYNLNRAEIDTSIAINNVWRAVLQKAAAAGDLSYFTNQVN